MGIGPYAFLGLFGVSAMRAEVKVYMSHTDAARVNMACVKTGETLSGFMRRLALAEADRLAVPVYSEELPGQMALANSFVKRLLQTTEEGGK